MENRWPALCAILLRDFPLDVVPRADVGIIQELASRHLLLVEFLYSFFFFNPIMQLYRLVQPSYASMLTACGVSWYIFLTFGVRWTHVCC